MEKQSGLTKFMEEKFVPAAAAIGGQRHLMALRDGIVMIMPLLLLGSFAMIILDFPIESWTNMVTEAGWGWDGHLDTIVETTFGISALVAAFGVSSSLAGSYKKKNGQLIDGTPAGIMAIASFFIVNYGIISEGGGTGNEFLFVGMLFGIFTGEVYRLFVQKDWVIKLPDSVPAAISRQFTALMPGLVVLGFSWLAIAIPFAGTEYGTISIWLNEGIFGALIKGGLSYPVTMFAAFIEHLLWSFGLHGSAIVIFPFFEPLWTIATTPDTKEIFTWAFYENSVWIGGSGATLPVVIYMLLLAKSKLLKDIGKIAIGPGLFNINEPVTFGLPVVLNPMLMIPYILSPMIIITILYFGTAAGLFPILDKMVPWTTPIFISGFLASSGGMGERIMAVVSQVIAFTAAGLIWFPFIRAWDNINVKLEKSA
jgi:PTS system cellobiose-specific IIC component